MKIKEIFVNKVQCNHCGDIIESRYDHDFVYCSCKAVAIDGGKSYLRRLCHNFDTDFIELSVYRE